MILLNKNKLLKWSLTQTSGQYRGYRWKFVASQGLDLIGVNVFRYDITTPRGRTVDWFGITQRKNMTPKELFEWFTDWNMDNMGAK